jgi:hypothetical protein
MGFEIVFHYKEGLDSGKYEEEVKKRSVKVGSVQDEISLDAVAAKIFAQLARRNILVVDVEIYEFTKKRLNYREAEDGFFIKNRKFRFDDGPSAAFSSEEAVEESNSVSQLVALLSSNPEILSKILQQNGSQKSETNKLNVVNIPRLTGLGKPIREEVFDPPAFLKDEVRRRGLPFTVGKKYPIYEEKANSNSQAGVDYITVDDTGQKRTINSIHFNLPGKLGGPFNNQAPAAGTEPNLLWEGMEDTYKVPDLRG